MKNTITIAFLLCWSTLLFAQEKWASFETTIAGQDYTIVEACGEFVELSAGVEFEKVYITSFGSTYKGAGRQVVGDSVFFKGNLLDNSAPTLLYDFSIEVGDTVYAWGEFIVTQVGYEYAAGESRKRITMENTLDGRLEVWLSGIGSITAGYLSPGSPASIPDFGSVFSCYLNEIVGEYYYGSNDTPPCALEQTGAACETTSVEEKENEEIVVFPNPANEFITIEFDATNNRVKKLQLHSSHGQMIFSKTSTENSITIDVSSMTNGMYVLEVEQDGGRQYYKIVVQ